MSTQQNRTLHSASQNFHTQGTLEQTDPVAYQIACKELARQERELNLIASENYAHPAVLQALATALSNKYAEGYPGARYYAGCEVVDEAERLAIERCKLVFPGAEHVNVQSHSGTNANDSVYFALLNPGDTILGLKLSHGGHLTHGHSASSSGKRYNPIRYGLDPKTELIDYDEVRSLAHAHKPKLIIAGASAYSRIIDFAKFRAIADEVGAYFMVDIAHIAGLIAAGQHPSPFPHAHVVTSTTHKTLRGPRSGLIMCTQELAKKIDTAVMPGTQGGPHMNTILAKAVAFGLALQPEFKDYQRQVIKNAQAMAHEFKKLGYTIVSDGTDNHLFTIDLRNKERSGIEAETALTTSGIIVNRNTIPSDEKPWAPSGIRIGTPAMTTRGMQEEQAQEIVQLIDTAITHHQDQAALAGIKKRIAQLCKEYPIYPFGIEG